MTELPNVWLGTSVEDGNVFFRIEELHQVAAAVRFVDARSQQESSGISVGRSCPEGRSERARLGRMPCPVPTALLLIQAALLV